MELARQVHEMVPRAFHSQEAIRENGSKERMRASEEVLEYVPVLESLLEMALEGRLLVWEEAESGSRSYIDPELE